MIKVSPKVSRGRSYLTIAFILAGSSVISASYLLGHLPAFTITFLSLVFAAGTAIILCGKKMYKTAKTLSKKTWIVIALQALFGCFLFRIFLTLGLQNIGTTEAGILTGATPAITALFTWLLLRERLNTLTIVGIVITIAGILLVQGFPFETTLEELQPLGVILVLCAVACEAFFTTLSRKIYVDGEKLPPFVHAGFVSVFAMVLCFIPALLERPWASITKLQTSGWLALVWYGSIVTIVAFGFMFLGAKRCDGYTLAAFAGIMPISSVVLSATILDETIKIYQVIGCTLIVYATLLISKKRQGLYNAI